MSGPAISPSWTMLAHDPVVISSCHPPVAKLNSLPVEILFFIFSISQADGWAGLALTTLQLVCRKWRHFIVNNKLLWTTIRITIRGNDQVRRIEPSLQSRLMQRWPESPLHVTVTLFGLWEHDRECECGRDGYEDSACEWQDALVDNLRALLRILAGPSGQYMACWTSFLLDVSQWGNSGAILWEVPFQFHGLFDHPAPLLNKVQLWSVNSVTKLFPDAPSLSAVRLRECFLTNPMDLTGIRRVWIDSCNWDDPLINSARWVDLVDVEELTLRVWMEKDVDDGELLDNLAFRQIRKLQLLGYVPKKILEAVGDRQLEQLVLRVSSPADLLSVIESPIVLQDIGEVVLGGFSKLGPDTGSLASAEARHSAFRELFNSANPIGITQVTLLDIETGEDLLAAGINIDGARYWAESRSADEMGVIEPWSADEWERGPDPKYLNPEKDDEGSGDEEMEDGESNDEESESEDEESDDEEIDEDADEDGDGNEVVDGSNL